MSALKRHVNICKKNPDNDPKNQSNIFALVKNEGLKEFTEALCPHYKLPSCFTVSKGCSKYYLEEKKKLLSFVSKSTQTVHLKTDTWTSLCQKTNYMVLTAHFIDDEWVMHKCIINFKPIHSHKGEDIGREIYKCMVIGVLRM